MNNRQSDSHHNLYSREHTEHYDQRDHVYLRERVVCTLWTGGVGWWRRLLQMQWTLLQIHKVVTTTLEIP